MKIHLYCILRNEAHLLNYFFRHYNQFVDKYFMFDDCSDDGSREIIQGQERAELIDCEVKGLDDDYFSRTYSTAFHERSRGLADWVMCVAVDEFLYHPNMRQYLFERMGTNNKALICRGYQMLSEHFPRNDGQIYDEVNEGVPDLRYSLMAVFNPWVSVVYGPGREECRLNAEPEKSAIKLLHYRFVGRDYVRERHERNFSRLTENNKKHGWGTHTSPEYQGQYNLAWYEQALKERKPCLD